MKVIKEGQLPYIFYTVNCNNCKAILEYDKKDICFYLDYQYVICPCCESQIEHKHA